MMTLTMSCNRVTQGPTGETGVILDESPAAQHPPQEVPTDVQEIPVEIVDEHFASERYSIQTGPTWLLVTSQAGSHSLSIDGLVNRESIPAQKTVRIGFTAPEPGLHMMRLDENGDTAVLDVRPLGGR
jgi:hypothetical protein